MNVKNGALLGLLLLFLGAFAGPSFSQTANPNTTQATKDVLNYLSGLKNKSSNKLILGQHLGPADTVVQGYNETVVSLQNQTGKWLGMIGGDYGFADTPVQQANQVFIDYWNAGGLVYLNWHLSNPWTGGDSWDTNNQENLYELTTPGSPVYNRWRAQLNDIANALTPLRDAGVVVMWRPLHEMNGDWFWWGQKTWPNHEGAYINLWRNMFNYLSNERGLNNLLWVYSTGNSYERILLNYYPGSQFVDVAGIDLYDDNLNLYNNAGYYQDLRSLGHPMGFNEVGPTISSAYGNYDYRRLLNNIKSKYPDFVFASAWNDWPGVNVSFARNNYMAQVMNDPWVVNLDEIDFSSPAPAPTPTPTPTPPPDDSALGTFRLRNLWTGKYLHQNQGTSGTLVSMQALNPDWTSQQWTIEEGPQNSVRLKCGWEGLLNNAQVRSWTFQPSWGTQRWVLEQVSGSTVRVKSQWTGRYLYAADQTNVRTYDLNPQWGSQLWVLEEVQAPVEADPLLGEWRIRNAWSNTYLSQNDSYSSAPTSLSQLNPSWYSQRWNIEAGPYDTYRLRGSWVDLYLHNTQNVNHAAVGVWDLNPNWGSQMWTIEPLGNDQFRIKNQWTGRYLNTQNQQNMVTTDLNPNYWSMIWYLDRVN